MRTQAPALVNDPPKRSSQRAVCTAILVGLFTAATGCDRGQHPGQIGQPAPQFTITQPDVPGAQPPVNLAKLRGHVVVLNFWATWCAPCIQEFPALEALQRDLPQVRVLGVSTDLDTAAYARFVQTHAINFPTIDDAAQRANALYGTFRYPETYVIDKTGVLRRKFIGPQAWTDPEIEDYLRKLAS